MKYPLVRPNMPKLSEVQEYYQLAEKQGQYANFGLCHDLAIRKIQAIYPNTSVALTNNGTTALQLALQTMLPRGSRVGLPTFTFIATLNAVVNAGMVPVLFDVDPNTWQIDKNLLADYKKELSAFIVVSPFGYYVDVEGYDALANDLGCQVVYDFAAAWGHKISSINPTTFSFHATKTLPIGEGGAVLCPGDMGGFQSYGVKRFSNFDVERTNPHSNYGTNAKMDELHAAALCVQLDKNQMHLDSTANTKWLVNRIAEQLGRYHTIQGRDNCYPQLPIIRVDSHKLDTFIKTLNNAGIATRRYYSPLLHEAFPDIEFTGGIGAPKTTVGIAKPLTYNEAADIFRYYIIKALDE